MAIIIRMPALSPTMEEGALATWFVKEGDKVAAGDMLAEIETDKATMEFEAIDEGVVGKLLVVAGTEGIKVNEAIAVLLEEGEDISVLEGLDLGLDLGPAVSVPAAVSSPALAAAPVLETPSAPAPVELASAPVPAPTVANDGGKRIFSSPLARRIAGDAGLDMATLAGSGPGGRIVKRDVEAALAAGPVVAAAAAQTAPVTPAAVAAIGAAPFEPSFELEKLSAMRKTIARRLTESKQTVPHFYLTVDCEIDALLAARKELNAGADGAFKISVNDLVIKAAAIALRQVPEANSSFSEAGIKRYQAIDISVAVATDRGLITPVIRAADQKGLAAISTEMTALAGKARDGKLQPEEYQGGTFSISNLGMFGIKQFDAVINPPQGCILAVAAGEPRPVVKDGALAVATVMSVTLSVDHRVVDGALGAQYLAAFKALIQNPLAMLL